MAKKRHHYIPEFYLKGFADPYKECIWVYEKGNSNIFSSSPKNIAIEKHYYSFTKEDGSKDTDSFENLFAEIESNAAPIFMQIHDKNKLTEEDKAHVALFLASMLLRVPNHRKNIENAHAEIIKRFTKTWASNTKGFEASLRKYEQETGNKIDIPVKDLQEFAADENRYDIAVNPQFSLGMIKSVPEIANILRNMT